VFNVIIVYSSLLLRCNCCLVTGEVGLNLVMKTDVLPISEYASSDTLPDLIQSVPTSRGDTIAENKVVQFGF